MNSKIVTLVVERNIFQDEVASILQEIDLLISAISCLNKRLQICTMLFT